MSDETIAEIFRLISEKKYDEARALWVGPEEELDEMIAMEEGEYDSDVITTVEV